jgi:hypothetical protein
MALFKILRGESSAFTTDLQSINIYPEFHDGYCYFIADTGLFYIDYDGVTFYFSYEKCQWEDKVYFTNEGDILHEKKVAELIDIVRGKCGIDISLPYNLGEKWSNSIDDYMLCSISFNDEQKIYSFSGARIHKK